MNNIKFSVYVCAYNQEKNIEKCIDSILNQDYDNLEVIIINDGSTDNTLKVIEKYKNKCIIVNQTNRGLALSRKKALQICTGDYIGTVDADDYVAPNWLSSCKNAIIKTDADAIVSGFYYVNSNGKVLKNNSFKLANKSGKNVVELLSEDKLKNMVWSYVARANLYKNILSSFENITYYEDLASTYLIMMQSHKVVFLPDNYYYYVQHKGTITKLPSMKQVKDLEHIRHQINVNMIHQKMSFNKNWNFHIYIMEYQICSLINSRNNYLNNLRKYIIENIPERLSGLEKIKLLLIWMNAYKFLYPFAKKIKNAK
ncbi:glycosyltransferase family 2 protein [Limosilactobacillus reuteri]|uniref:glycosyltransferase family 2 protein n=1 Tax=Limosilactobacillus reuteri TaxID=1598 RepID=UPI001F4E74F6|nr:glycosyltransferase family 2 protein [Limosilactobacillus reuteri]MCH9394646.1 glycosyltransferase family 2 protein [Limosilactobacillus reuteri]